MIRIGSNQYSYTEIKEHNFEKPVDEWKKSILDFCGQWLNGNSHFNLNTSGSTGTPKSIRILRSQMEASAKQTIEAMGLKAGDSALVCINTDYIGGKMMLVRGMEASLNLDIIPPSSNPLIELESTSQYDLIALVPLQLNNILQKGGTGLDILNKAKAIIVGGASMDISLVEQAQKVKAPIYSTYGMTETVSHIALKRINGVAKSNYYKLLPGITISQDNRGCLTIVGEVTSNKLLVTNDIVKFHKDHEFEILGRADHVINSGGVKIQLEKIEKVVGEVLYQLGFPNRYIALGIDDKLLGEKLVVVIESPQDLVFKSEVSFQEILKKRIPKYEVPKKIFYLNQFPELESGKVNKKEIKERIKKLIQ